MAVTPDAVRRGTVLLVRLPGDKARPAVVVRSDLLSELS
jgi:mRNA-degrading endonuclease toxin of MazEF toxin-antitoxin module